MGNARPPSAFPYRILCALSHRKHLSSKGKEMDERLLEAWELWLLARHVPTGEPETREREIGCAIREMLLLNAQRYLNHWRRAYDYNRSVPTLSGEHRSAMQLGARIQRERDYAEWHAAMYAEWRLEWPTPEQVRHQAGWWIEMMEGER